MPRFLTTHQFSWCFKVSYVFATKKWVEKKMYPKKTEKLQIPKNAQKIYSTQKKIPCFHTTTICHGHLLPPPPPPTHILPSFTPPPFFFGSKIYQHIPIRFPNPLPTPNPNSSHMAVLKQVDLGFKGGAFVAQGQTWTESQNWPRFFGIWECAYVYKYKYIYIYCIYIILCIYIYVCKLKYIYHILNIYTISKNDLYFVNCICYINLNRLK